MTLLHEAEYEQEGVEDWAIPSGRALAYGRATACLVGCAASIAIAWWLL
jgi:hypothetical protein